MGKEKKTKKGRGEDEVDDDVPKETKGKQVGGGDDGPKSKKKGGRKKKGDDDWEDDVSSEIASMTVSDKKEENEGSVQDEGENRRKDKKKTRKAAAKEEQDSDEDIIVSSKPQKKGKQASSDNEDEVVAEKGPAKKGKKQYVMSDDDDQEEDFKPKPKANKKGKKGKKEEDDDDDHQDFLALASKKKNKTKSSMDETDFTRTTTKTAKPKSVFELLEVEDMDVDMGSDDDEQNEDEAGDEAPSSTQGKETEKKKEEKSGKKGKKDKKKQEEDEELERMLADIEQKDTKKKKDKQKEPPPPEVEEKGVTIVTEIPDDDDDKPKKRKKKKKDGAADEEKSATTTEDQEQANDKETAAKEDEDEEGGTVKSAAQKKKEKKERERQKKLAQKAQQEKKKDKDDVDSAAVEESVAAEVKAPVPAAKIEEEKMEAEDGAAEGEDMDDGKKKKDKKGAKKTDKEEKDKKRPGKKQIFAMQEALKKMKEDEEARRLEEEAKERAAEEAEKQRLEKVRLEQERKEKRKLKEKEKRERLKAEGKLLSQSQKQQRARAQAMLESLRAQGIDVPKIGEKKERTPRPGDRVRPKKAKQDVDGGESKEDTPDSGVQLTDSPSLEQVSELTELTEVTEVSIAEEEVGIMDVKESWDQESDEDTKASWDAASDTDKQDTITDSDVRKSTSGETQVPDDESGDESTKTSGSESEGSGSESDDDSETESEDDSEEDQKTAAEKLRERAVNRMQKRREENEKNRTVDNMRSPVVCVLGHVDTGKTKILDKIRRTHVQDSEAGGITQQIGATMVPMDAIREQTKMVKSFANVEMKIPGLLIIDTPGHESFSNLRSRGSSLCDIAILVVDIMHGLEPQTIESINLLKQKKTPFVVALNKVDRLYEWKPCKNKDIRETLKSQNRNTQLEFEERVKSVVLQFAEQSLNATLFYENADQRIFISLIPTSAHSGDGMGNLISLIVELTQNMMAKRLAFTEELQATVLEVKAIPGLGTTIDVILVNGTMREGDSIILAGVDGPLVTQVRSLLMPQPLKEMRVKNPYQEFKEVKGSQGVKVTGKDLEKAIAGLNLLIAHHPDEVEICKEEVAKELQTVMNSIKLAERGVFVQASTLGSLEALLEFLRTSKIPYAGIRIGPVVKKDVMKASIMLEHDSQYAVILAFDVKIERDAQDLADNLGVKIFAADIIYHLFDKFMEYREELKQKKRDQFKHVAVFPCKLRILPQFIFNTRDPIVVGVSVEAGVLREGTPLAVPSKDFLEIGTVTTIEVNHKTIDTARKGQEVCIKIEPCGGEAPKLYGRHFDHTDMVVSKITRQSIDACKEYFRDDLQKTDWALMVELKKMFQIL